MLLSRYNGQRQSYISCKRSNSSTALSKLSYHTSKKQTLKPLTDCSVKETNEEPIADEGVPKFLTTVPVTKHMHHTDLQLKRNQPFGPVITAENLTIFNENCDSCCQMCDFSDPESDVAAKSLKSSMLKEILDCINVTSMPVFTQDAIDHLFNMISTNLNRPIPPIPRKYLCFDDEPLIIEVNWPHLSMVHQILKNYHSMVKTDERLHAIRKTMLSLLRSSDPNERDFIYDFFMDYVKNFPEQLDSVLIDFGYKLIEYKDGGVPFVVTPILRFISEQIKIAGRITPIVDAIWKNSILPLISCQHNATIYPAFMQVVDSLSIFDKQLPKTTLRVTLHHWPESRPSKQISYFFLMNSLIEKLTAEDFEQVCQTVFKLYAGCALSSQHAKVIETSFHVWSNVKIIQMIMDNTRAIFPIVYPTYQKIMKEHWKGATQDSALNAIKSMHDLDPFMFDELAQAQKKGLHIGPEDLTMNLHKNWASVARAAAKTDKSVNLARVLAEIQLKFARPIEPVKNEQFRKVISSASPKPPIIAPKTSVSVRF